MILCDPIFRFYFLGIAKLESSITKINVNWIFAVIDCTVSEWGIWSECDVSCGTGMMTRTRTVLTQPENGGKHCPSLTQKRGCQGFKCHGQHERRVLRGNNDTKKKWNYVWFIFLFLHEKMPEAANIFNLILFWERNHNNL